MALGWFGKSLVGALLLIPPFLSINFFVRNFQLRPEVILIWYFVGLAVGCFGEIILLGMIKIHELSPSFPLAVIFALGIIFGATSNVLLFQAMPMSPNPGMPVALINTASVATFLAAIGLAVILPKWFDACKFDIIHFSGIILTAAGVILLSLHR